jgi:regulator of protease activity HflC (stomatin/prohibitin superfamily)
MARFRWIKIREFERGLLFKDRQFRGVLKPGRHLFLDPLWRVKVDVVSVREPWLRHPDLEVIVRSGVLGNEAQVLDLAEYERALVWVNGRFEAICGPGLSVLWTVFQKVEAEVVDARGIRFDPPDLGMILERPQAAGFLERASVEASHVAMVFVDGSLCETLEPGTYAFWRGVGRVRVLHVDLRERTADVAGQEIMTADRVTLRINAVVTWRVTDPEGFVGAAEDGEQALYREAQLALREVVGARALDAMLKDREAVAAELTGVLRERVRSLGVAVDKLGIRDIVLPGEMKELLNRVTEARAAAEASLITRREETAAMRSQANTARILESNPTLMRLRELEVLEKVAETSQLQVVLGESGLTDRLVKLL